MPTDVGPHDYFPIRWWDRWLKNGRCRSCVWPRSEHPKDWSGARAMHDRRYYDVQDALLAEAKDAAEEPRRDVFG